MTADPPGFRLRKITPADGPALSALIAASPDAGMIRFRPVPQVDPYIAMTYGDTMTGVVAEHDGLPGLAGLGIVSFGDLVLRGERRPYALLHSLIVHPDARRQGLAAAIIDWRLARAREQVGDDAVTVATIQRSNTGSFAAATRWATQISEPLISHAMRPRTTPPAGRPEWRARPAGSADLEAFAAGFTAFRADYDLSAIGDATELAAWLERTPLPGRRIHQLWVVEDQSGNLLAGLGLSEVRRASIVRVDAMPLSIQLMNTILQVIPRSRSMEMVPVTHLWFRPGAQAAGSHLFQVARHQATELGNVVTATYDPRSPLGPVIAAPRWLPHTSFSVAIRGPESLRPDRPIDPVQ